MSVARAMPPLDSPENIRGFIACVAHGILMEAISPFACNRLLYAAQAAVTASRATGEKPK
jgi:hypothetical protein